MADAINNDSAEIWKPVPGWEDFYEVSSLGRVMRLPRFVTTKNGALALKPRNFLTCPVNNRSGYPEVLLCDSGRKRRANVHSLVCEAFHGPKPTTIHQVAHNDGTRTNNRSDNLRWATPKENAFDRNSHGTAPIGEGAGNAKLTEHEVLAIRSEYQPGYGSLAKLGRKYRVTSTQILHIVRRRQWTHI